MSIVMLFDVICDSDICYATVLFVIDSIIIFFFSLFYALFFSLYVYKGSAARRLRSLAAS